LYSQKTNPQLEAYNKAAEVGEMFIRNTEDMLLKINLMMGKQVLDARDKHSLQKLVNEI